MTAGELIAILSEVPTDSPVYANVLPAGGVDGYVQMTETAEALDGPEWGMATPSWVLIQTETLPFAAR